METTDPFDEILMRCIKDKEEEVHGKASESVIKHPELIRCHHCSEVLSPNFRYCPNCGEPTADMSGGDTDDFIPISMQKRTFRITVLDIDADFRIEGEYFTKVKLRIENLTDDRIHLSLTFVDSVVVDAGGRQLNPVDGDASEFPGVFDPWFYIYPRAYREGLMVFPEIHEKIKSLYICCNPQNAEEEELFHFKLDK